MISEAFSLEGGREELHGSPVVAVTLVAYLLLLTTAELVVTFSSPPLGMVLHSLIMFGLVVQATLAPSPRRDLLTCLIFAPLIRLVSLGLPLSSLPSWAWYLVASLPLFVAMPFAARLIGLSRERLGLRWGRLPRELAVGLIGLPLGLIEYVILRPQAIASADGWLAPIAAGVILLICTGLLEELIFRGFLQTTAAPLLGRWGVVYASGIFAVLHIGYRSIVDVTFVFGVGLLFGWIVARGRSLLGVTLAHGLTNILLLVVLPLATPALAPVFDELLISSVAVEPPTLMQVEAAPEPAVPAALSKKLAKVEAGRPEKAASKVKTPSATVAGDEPAGTLEAAPLAPAGGLLGPASTTQNPAGAPGGTDDWVPYEIKPGDTLWSISVRYQTSVSALLERNNIPDRSLIVSRTKIVVPKT